MGNFEKINDEIILDKDMGLGNVVQLTEALNEISRRNYVTVIGPNVKIENELRLYIDSIIKLEKVQTDLNKIMYFVDIVSSYNEDVILSAFFNDPNVENAIVRGKKEIELSDNKLKRKRSIVSILTKKYLIASRQVLVCDNDLAVFLTKAIDLPENSDPCHPYDLGFLTANIQNNRMV